jgi:hypothetical protein
MAERMSEYRFDIVVDKVPYHINVQPFEFNSATRFRVSYNGGPEHIFTWDERVQRLAPIDDDASTIPDDLEVAIAERLESGRY